MVSIRCVFTGVGVGGEGGVDMESIDRTLWWWWCMWFEKHTETRWAGGK